MIGATGGIPGRDWPGGCKGKFELKDETDQASVADFANAMRRAGEE